MTYPEDRFSKAFYNALPDSYIAENLSVGTRSSRNSVQHSFVPVLKALTTTIQRYLKIRHVQKTDKTLQKYFGYKKFHISLQVIVTGTRSSINYMRNSFVSVSKALTTTTQRNLKMRHVQKTDTRLQKYFGYKTFHTSLQIIIKRYFQFNL